MYSELPCLPLIQERFINVIKDKIDEKEIKSGLDIEMTMFTQIWGSTALGFGGIGGQSMTKAYTVVVQETYTGWCAVFFGDKLAYCIHSPNRTFLKDLSEHHMRPVYAIGEYK